MYTTKDLANLLQMLQTSRQSGSLIIEPLEQEQTSWQGYFRLVNGQITSCGVRNKLGRQIMLSGDEGMRWLIDPARGKLEWSLQEEIPSLEPLLPLMPTQKSNENDELTSESTYDTNPSLYSNNSGNFPRITPPRQNNSSGNFQRDTSPLQQNNSGNFQRDTSPLQQNNSQTQRPYEPIQKEQLQLILRRTIQTIPISGTALSSRDHRQVLALIDGHRSIEEIAQLLHKAPDVIFRILRDLQSQGFIA